MSKRQSFIDEQHRIRTRLLALGRRRADLQDKLAGVDDEIASLLDAAAKVEIPVSEVGELTGVSRPTLYRWSDRSGS